MDSSACYQFRIVVVGDATAGKTALVQTLVSERYPLFAEHTVGSELFISNMELENDIKVRLQIWDTAGQEKYKSLIRWFYRNAMGVLLVYDVGNRSSFNNIINWINEAERYTDNASLQLVACKCDINEESRQVNATEGRAFADSHQMKFIETSAKTQHNVKDAFKMIAKTLMEKVQAGVINANTLRGETSNDPSTILYKPIGKKNPKCTKCNFS